MSLIANFSYTIMLKMFPKPIIRSKCLAWYSRPFVICPGPSFVSFPALLTSTLCSGASDLSSPTSGHTPFSVPLLKSFTTWDSLTPYSFLLKPGLVLPPLGSPSRPRPVNNESGLPWILSEQWDSGAQSGLAQLKQGGRPSHLTEGSFRPGSGSRSTLHIMRGIMCAIKSASRAKGQGHLLLASTSVQLGPAL